MLSAIVGSAYLLTLAPSLVWQPASTGSLLASIQSPEFFSISPSPLYFLLGQLWKRIPLGTLALRGNLLSLALALSVVLLVFYLTYELTKDIKPAFFGAVVMAFLPFLWRFAAVANFETLLLLVMWSFLEVTVLDKGGRHLGLATFLLGLCLSITPAAVVMVVPYLYHLLTLRSSGTALKFGSVVAGLFLGLSPAVFAGFLGVPLFRIYSSLVPLTPLWSSVWQNLLSFLEFCLTMPWPLFVLAVVGLLWGSDSKERTTLMTFALPFVILFGIYPFAEITGIYLFPISVVVLLSALGFRVIWDLLTTISNTEIGAAFENKFFVLVVRLKRSMVLLRYLSLGSFLVFVFWLPFWNLKSNLAIVDRHSDRTADDYLQGAERYLSDNSLFLADSDEFLSVLRYLSSVKARESAVVTGTNMVLDRSEYERISRWHPNLWLPGIVKANASEGETEGALKLLVSKNLGHFDVFLTLDRPSSAGGGVIGRWGIFSLVSEGPLYRVLP